MVRFVGPAILLVAYLCYHSCFITYIEPRLPLPGFRAAPGAPWPMPKEWVNSSFQFTVDPKDFEMKTNLVSCDVIDRNLDLYRNLIFPDQNPPPVNTSFTLLKGIELTISSGQCEDYPKFNSNENYFLEIKEGNPIAQLKTNTIWGGLRALETLSQLIFQCSKDKTYYVNETKISDSPRFQHRGLLIDTARHFQPKSILLRNLDAMQWNKMNVFHWHVTDDQAFPYESLKFPNLSTLGAYSPKHIYSQEDVAEIIEYARIRGIRVIPEFDSPGHTRAIGNAFKNLLTPCYGDGVNPYTPNFTAYSEMEVFNPINEDVYTFMKDLISEVKTVFKDEYVHLGLDEVWYDCWASNPDIKKFMKDNNMTEMSELESHYVKRLIELVSGIGYKYIAWQDPVDNGVEMNANTIVQIWKDNQLDKKLKPWREYAVPIINKGYKVIVCMLVS